MYQNPFYSNVINKNRDQIARNEGEADPEVLRRTGKTTPITTCLKVIDIPSSLFKANKKLITRDNLQTYPKNYPTIEWDSLCEIN